MTHIIDKTVFSKLSEENQEKVVNIYHLADMLKHHQCPPLSWEDFVDLYDAPLHVLESHTQLKAHTYGVPRPELRPRPEQRTQCTEEGD